MKWGSRGQFFASDTTLCFVSRSPGSQNVCERETGPKSWLWQESIGPDCFLSVHGHRSWNLQIPTIPPTGSWFTESQRLKLRWGSDSHPHCSTSVLHCRLRVRCGTWRFKVFVLQVGTVCFLNDLYPCYLTWTNLNPLPPRSQGSPSRAGYGFDATSLKQHQVGRTVTAGHAGLVARSNLIPVVTGFGTAWSAGVVHSTVFTLSGWWRKVKYIDS